MFDVVGDVHAHEAELERLAAKAGYFYEQRRHVLYHPDGYKLVFIGDMIDRGTENIKTIKIIRNTVEAGLAHAVMGNHELNAVLWATPDPNNPKEYLRKHSDAHRKQHRTFLKEMEGDPDFYASTIEWFKSLPLFLKLDNNKFAHACWYDPAIQDLKSSGCVDEGGRLTDKGWAAVTDKKSPYRASIKILLNGPEEDLPPGFIYQDTQGHERRTSRVAWWREKASTYGEALASLPSTAFFVNEKYVKPEGDDVASDIRARLAAMPENERIFFGHFSQKGEPRLLSARACCVDFAGPTRLAAYRIGKGETKLDNGNFAWIDTSVPVFFPVRTALPLKPGALICRNEPA